MKFRPHTFRTIFLMLTLISAGITNLYADTISWPVSVAIPSAVNGEVNSLSVSVQLQPANLGDPDLVGLWHMDGDWTDLSGNGLHGTPYNGATFSADRKIGANAGSFNGSSYAAIGNLYGKFPNNTVSIEAWVKLNDTGNGAHKTIAGGTGSWADYEIGIVNNKFFAQVCAGTNINYAVIAELTPALGQWYHVVGTFDGSVLKLYVNGALMGSIPAVWKQATSNADFWLGGGYCCSSYRLNSLIDEVAVYKRPLSADEIAQHYAAGVSDPNAPAAPVIDTVPAFIGANSIALSGTRPANTSIWVNNKKIVTSDASTTWQGTYTPLQPGNNLLNITAFDEARLLQSPAVSKIVFLDNIPPVIEGSSPANNSNTAMVVSNVSITLFDANAGVDANASIQGATVKNSAGQTIAGNWNTSGSRTIVFTPSASFAADTYTVAIQATDMVGNKQQQQIAFTNHDTGAPTTKVTLTGTKDSAGWYSTPVTVILTADDTADGSGIAKVEYSLDSGATWQTYATPFVIEQDGKITLMFRATDEIGNVETVKSQEIKVNKTGLVGWWKMDGDWKDASVVGNDATPYNGAAFNANTKTGNNSGQFNGSNSYVSIPDSPSLHSERNLSVSGWMYVNGFNKTWQSIFWKGNTPDCTTDCENREYALWLNSSGYLHLASTPNDRVGIGQLANDTQAQGGFIQVGRWQHFAAVISSDQNYMKVYIDGVEKVSTAYNSAGIRDSGYALIIGGNPSWDSYFNGLLDDIRIYNRALSATEIMEQFRNLSIGIPTVVPVTSPVNTPTITLSGAKPANTSVVISNGGTGTEIAPQSDAAAWTATTWQGQYTLTSGMNNLSITAKDVDGFHSQAVTVNVALDDTPPAVSSSDPPSNSLFKTPVSIINFNLTDAFSPLDLTATIAEATVKSGSNLDVTGAWTTSGSGTTGSAIFTADMPMGEGAYTASITPTDSFGNKKTATLGFTIDMTAPVAPTIDPVPSPSNTATKTITGGKSSDSSRVVANCAGATIGTVSYPSETTWSVPVSGLREGINTITAYSLDSAGNQSAPASAGFTIDLTPPAKPTIDAPVTPTNKSSITLTGGKEANSWLYVNNSKTSAPFSDTTWSAGVAINEGSNTVTVFARDEAGNQGQGAQVTVVRDTASPSIAASTPTVNAISGSVGSVSITLTGGTALPDLAASLPGAVIKNVAGAVISGSWSVSGETLLFTPAATFTEGVYTVTIYPVDVLGNKGSASFSFTVDQGPPTVQSLTMNPASPIRAGTATFTLFFSEGMDTTVQPQVSFGSANYGVTGSWLDNRNWRGSHVLTAAMGDGSYSVTVKGARDIAGNGIADQIAGTFLLDTTPPATPAVAAVTALTKTAIQPLTGAKPADSAIVINGQVRVPLNSATTWSYSYPLSEGANTLTIVARDAAGNDSAAIAPAPVITLDTTPPAFTVDTWQNPATSAAQTVSGKKEPGCIVKLSGVQIIDGGDQNADWSYTLTLVDGMTNHLVFTATDVIGNVTTRTLDILFDSVPPTALGAGVLAADGNGRGTEATLSWPSYPEPAALAYYRVFQAGADFSNIGGLTPIGTVSKGTRSYKATGLTMGAGYWFAVVPVSISGNSDPSVHTASAVPTDTAAPEDITNLSAVAGWSAADGNSVTLSWSAGANTSGDQADQIVYMDAGQGYDTGTPVGKTATTFTKKGLNDAAHYKFKVTAKDTLNHESAGTVVQAMTRLNNPTGLAIVPGNAKATLSWQPVASSYVKLYNIYRVKSDTPQTDVAGMPLVKSQTATSFTDTGLTNDSVYQYAVTVLNTSGAERSGVQSVAVTPRGDTTPPVISGFNLTANQVVSAPITIIAGATDSESALERIELYIDTVKVATITSGTLSYSWNVIDTSDGNHSIRIVAYDAPGNKAETTVPVVVSMAAPTAPVITTTFGSSITQNNVTISGTTQPGATITLRVNGVAVSSASTSTSTFSFAPVSLVEGDNYVAVKAVNRGGESPYSADLKVTVDTGPPLAPTALTVKLLAGGAIQFVWQAASGEMPTGFNLYESAAPFTSSGDSGVSRTNGAPIAYLLKEQIPADDTPRYYAVSALDGAGNESPVSNVVSIASDRLAPTVSEVTFTQNSKLITQNSPAGPGPLTIVLTVGEALREMPFLSLEPQSGSPVVVPLRKLDDTRFEATLTIDATSPHGPTTWKFSGKDQAGNRGNGQGSGPILDVRGPVASITAPLTLLKTTAGPATIGFTLDEVSTITPVMELSSPGGSAPVTALTSSDGIHWSGTLDPSALAEGNGRFVLTDARDRFNNRGNSVASGANIVLYKTVPPAPSVPMGLTARAFKGGEARLAWMPVTDAQGYNLYRQGSGDATPIKVATLSGSGATTYSESVAPDGSYAYSISSIGLLDAESAPTTPVSVVTDATAPSVPMTLVLAMTGNGVKAEWQEGGGEATAFYRLYRSDVPITAISGLTPLATVKELTAFDPSPDSSRRFYAVTSLDLTGNESAPSVAPEFVFPVMPVRNLVLTRVDDGKPALSWEGGEANLQGFHIYRNSSRITTTPTLSTSFSDGYYNGGSVTYGVSAVNSLGTESAVREATLPELTIGLKEGTLLRRGVLENVLLSAAQPATAAAPLDISAVAVKIGSLPESTESGPFTVHPGAPLEIAKVAATEANAPPQVAVIVTAIMTPLPGVTVKVTRSSLASVLGSGTVLEIFNEPLVRGTEGKVRIKVNNLGTARAEFLTSENNGPTSHVRVYLKDQDGNVLAQGNLNQRTGEIVNSGSYSTVRIEPGTSFLSVPIKFNVPVSAPYRVIIAAEIENTYFHYNQADQVVAPGMRQMIDSTMSDVSYTAVAQTDKAVYTQGETVKIAGRTTASADGKPMPLVPVRIGISTKGFDRFFTVSSDEAGEFGYSYIPASNETGSFSVWAIHPDLKDRSVQAQFDIIGLQVSPNAANLTTSRNTPVDVPITLKNLSSTELTGLSLTPVASAGIAANVLNGGIDRLAGNESRTITFRLTPQQGAPETGYASLAIATAEGLSGKVEATITLVSQIPVIRTTPSYIDTGLVRGNQKIVSFTVNNSGMEALRNARIDGPSTPWMALSIDRNLGDIGAGLSREIGILLKPGDTMPQGVYDDRIVIYSDNHIPFTYNIQVTVTSSAVGSVSFNVMNELLKKVGGARITMQHQSVPELYYTISTEPDGSPLQGTASLTDIPEGRYSYNISAPGHKPFSSSLVVTPGIWTSIPVALEATLVQIEFSVTPVVLEDRYQIKISQTFETNVPTPVIVTEPPGISLPNLMPGEVFNGEFTITNYGLISAEYKGITFPTSIGDHDLELLANMPKTLNAMQKITVPYKITRRQTTASLVPTTPDMVAAALYDEVESFGGGACSGGGAITSTWEGIICPNTDNARTVTKSSNFAISYNSCSTTAGVISGGTPPSQQNTYYGSTTGGYVQNTGGGMAPLTPLPESDIVCIIPIPCVGSQCDDPDDPDNPDGSPSPNDPYDPNDSGDPTDPGSSDPPQSDPTGPPPPEPPGPDPVIPQGPPGNPTPSPSPDPPWPPVAPKPNC